MFFALLSIILWNTIFLFPIKIFSIVFHEIGHGFAAIFSGGEITSISINHNLGGRTIIKGGNDLVIGIAGYITSLLTGFMIYQLSNKYNRIKLFNYIVSSILLIMLSSVVKDTYTLIIFLSIILYLFLSTFLFNEKFLSLSSKIIGVITLLYVSADIFNDTFANDSLISDGQILERITGISSALWGLLWLLISGFIFYLLFRFPVPMKDPEQNEE